MQVRHSDLALAVMAPKDSIDSEDAFVEQAFFLFCSFLAGKGSDILHCDAQLAPFVRKS
jgi:hypothetical protein